MEIREIAGKMVKICPRSITVKDENDKTQGVVNGVRNYYALSDRDQFAVWDNMQCRKKGLSHEDMRNVYVKVSDLKHAYYLFDDHAFEYDRKYREDPDLCGPYLKKQKILDTLGTEYVIHVARIL